MGGAMVSCDGVVQSNLILFNSADTTGGGLARCDGKILNNTVVGNVCQDYGGGLFRCNATIANCILWGNDAGLLGDQIYGSTTPSFSCIQDWTEGGTGNISAPPDFANPDQRDYRLLPTSPCIDTGDNSVLSPPGLDMDGKLRIAFGRHSLTVDIGAYEHNSLPFAVNQVTLNIGGTLRLTWNSQPNDTYTIWSCDDLFTGVWIEEDNLKIPSQGSSTSLNLPAPVGQMKLYIIKAEKPEQETSNGK